MAMKMEAHNHIVITTHIDDIEAHNHINKNHIWMVYIAQTNLQAQHKL